MHPRKLYMRHKEQLEPGFLRSALELHYYRPAFYRWMRAVNENDQLLYEADLQSNSIVLDVGAYTGEWAEVINDKYSAQIVAFEPDPRNFRQLEKRFADSDRQKCFSYGLSGSNERLPISLEYLGSSVFNTIEGEKGVDWEDAQLRDISEVWAELSLDRVDLMKINIEGGEFPLLERMIETNLLHKVGCFLIQFHEWHPGAYSRRRAIRKTLAQTHELNWDYHFIWEKWTRKSK